MHNMFHLSEEPVGQCDITNDASIGIVMSYGLQPGFDPLQGLNFSLLHSIWNGSGAHPASYRMGTKVALVGGKGAIA
jgi:hypothetical protein